MKFLIIQKIKFNRFYDKFDQKNLMLHLTWLPKYTSNFMPANSRKLPPKLHIKIKAIPFNKSFQIMYIFKNYLYMPKSSLS